MIRLLLVTFLIAHGLVHGAIYTIPKKPDDKAPFDPGHSWVLSGVGVATHPARTISLTLGWVAAALFSLTGLLMLFGAGIWTAPAVLAVVVGLALKLGYFHPWLILGVLLDVGILVIVFAQWPSSLY